MENNFFTRIIIAAFGMAVCSQSLAQSADDMMYMLQMQAQQNDRIMQAYQNGDTETATRMILDMYVANHRRANNDYSTPDEVLYQQYYRWLNDPNTTGQLQAEQNAIMRQQQDWERSSQNSHERFMESLNGGGYYRNPLDGSIYQVGPGDGVPFVTDPITGQVYGMEYIDPENR
ncbi:hypothetical protein [Tropicimonas sp.]|uniref:hypothetical protein n=1 Tax=Tropicimonas sp. TaxID=2067044 RepID=UPI003A85BFD4